MRYYGCKDKLLDEIEFAAKKADLFPGAKVVDLFTGTTSVAKHFKKLGYTVIANDNLEFSYALAKTYIETNEVPKFSKLIRHLGLTEPSDHAQQIINYLNDLKHKKGFIYRNYAPLSTNNARKYFSDKNASKIDAIRTCLHQWQNDELINETEFYYILTSLLEAVNLVSNVAGTYGASLKQWDKRALKSLTLSKPEIIKSTRRNKAYKRDANELVKEISADLLYLDPPYNSRQYASNYFLLELIAEGWFNRKLKPQGVTGVLADKSKLSDYSRKAKALSTFKNLIDNARARFFVVSYSNEGIISQPQLKSVLSTRCSVELVTKKKHKRYKSINQSEKDSRSVDEHLYFVKVDNLKPRFNNLGGAEWLQNSFSVWGSNLHRNSEEMKLNHPAMFPIALAGKVIESYTRKNQVVLDPFIGSGSTAIASLQLQRNALGIDLSKRYIQMVQRRLKTEYKNVEDSSTVTLYHDDARNLLDYVQPNTVDLCLTSPPYWDILSRSRTADNKTVSKYSHKSTDLGNISDYDDFLDSMHEIFRLVFQATKPGGFLAVVLMDIRKKSIFYPLHSDFLIRMNALGYKVRDVIIWDRSSEYNNMKPLGYPYSFIINKVHEYILIFEK